MKASIVNGFQIQSGLNFLKKKNCQQWKINLVAW